MDFRAVVDDIAKQSQDEINSILKMAISPEEKIIQVARLIKGVGQEFAPKLFADVSELFDSTAISSKIDINKNNQIETLSRKIVRDSAFELDDSPITKEYFDVLLGRAENAAFTNARSLNKVPTLTRIMTGRETCEWCRARTGTFTNPDIELFLRHDNCDCIFRVSGYNSRNGVLKNYRKARS